MNFTTAQMTAIAATLTDEQRHDIQVECSYWLNQSADTVALMDDYSLVCAVFQHSDHPELWLTLLLSDAEVNLLPTLLKCNVPYASIVQNIDRCYRGGHAAYMAARDYTLATAYQR